TTTATCRFRSEYPPELSLFEESLVPLGRTLEEIVFSSPATRAWSEVLKLLLMVVAVVDVEGPEVVEEEAVDVGERRRLVSAVA
ncbi:hypothetical protein ACOICX_27785, partial [Klebsiella pneumoniae]|uniref:hypothetical protein n=1 Tax=Klebsiella pneumoniae TaxID=573 RepID=UPI003B594107